MSKVFKGIGKAGKAILGGIGTAFKKVWKSTIGKALILSAAVFITGGALGLWAAPGAMGWGGGAMGALGKTLSVAAKPIGMAARGLASAAKWAKANPVTAMLGASAASGAFQELSRRKDEKDRRERMRSLGGLAAELPAIAPPSESPEGGGLFSRAIAANLPPVADYGLPNSLRIAPDPNDPRNRGIY